MTPFTSERLLPSFFVALALTVPALAQTPAQAPAQPSALPPGAPTSGQAGTGPTATLTPAVLQVREAITGLNPNKWKAPGPVQQEMTGNIASIQRDIDSTLPGLLTTADRNPASVQDVLPAYRNVEALYDVLLRVTEVSKLAAPAQQSGPLQQATNSLDDARRALGDQLQIAAGNQTKAIVSLQTQLQTATSKPAAPQTVAAAAACPQTPAVAPKKRATAPKPKPATPPAATPAATH